MRGAGFPFAWLDGVVHRSDSSASLREVAQDARFREAVLWQNRGAVHDGLDSLLRKPPGATDSKTRKKELMVVRYLQRYCAKNDTIGFFGPVGWAQWGGKGRFVPQGRLLTARKVFGEPWMARVLADTLAQEPSLRNQAWVWLPGDLRVERRTLVGAQASYSLSAEEAAVLKLLQERGGPVRAGRLGRQQRLVLEQLAQRNMVRWTFPVAIGHDPLSRLPATQAMTQVRAGLRALSRLPGGAERETALDAALARLDESFTAATSQAPERHHGRTYAGRGLVYEECRRAVDLELSPAMRERIAGPLSVLLGIARWYTFQIASGLLRQLRRLHARLGGGAIPLHVFWARSASLFKSEKSPVIAPVVKRLGKLWNSAWGERASVTVEEAQGWVRRSFEAPCPGWPGARHHAPDLMWAASSAQEMLRGEGTPILGELHPGVTPLATLSVLAHAGPERRALERQWEADFEGEPITPIPWEDFARSSHDARLARCRWHLDLGLEFESSLPARRVLRAADFTVRLSGQRLMAVHRHRRLRFDLLQVFERRLKMLAASAFSLGDGQFNGPCRILGGMVVQRAHWRFDAEALGFLDGPEGRSERVAAFRSRHGLPRRMFVRSPHDVKPIYLDWDAPVLVEVLARLARQAPWLSFSEMLPGPDELWLKDKGGAAYVSELRCIAVDPLAWDGRRLARESLPFPRR